MTRRPRQAIVYIAALCTLSGVSSGTLGQPTQGTPERTSAPSDVPTAEQIFARHVEAMGGEDAVRKMKTRVGHGTFEMSGMASARRLSLWAEAPDKLHFRISDPLTGRAIDICTDGETSWERNGDAIERMTGIREQEFLEAAMFYGEVDYKAKYKDLQVLGTAELNGEKCWGLRVEAHTGRVRQLFFSQESGLLIGERATVATKGPDGRIFSAPVQLMLADYKEIEGVRWPMTQVMVYLGGERGTEAVLTVTQKLRRLEINKEGFDHDFSPPEDLPPAETAETAEDDADGTEAPAG